MATISINLNVPQGWHELDDELLRYVYSLIAKEFSADELKTLALLKESMSKVHRNEHSGKKNPQEHRRFNRSTGFNPLIIRHQQVEPWLAAAYPDGPTADLNIKLCL